MLRRVYPKVLARLLARTGDLQLAEDSLQDAVVRALKAWPREMPDSPEAWLFTAAKNRATDRHRRAGTRRRLAPALLAERTPWRPVPYTGWDDDLLRLVFTCCDPVLEVKEQAALTLATVAGMSTGEIAAAFLVAPRTMEQRLTRARRRLRERRGAYAPVGPEVAPDRLGAALAVVYLVFDAGYWASEGEPVRADLCTLATGLAVSLDRLLPDTPEVLALLALLWLHEGRRPARLGGGHPVPLDRQDRSKWDRACIEEGTALARRALELGAPGPLQIEAAIAAVHCVAERAEDTDWPQIAVLYRALEEQRASGVVRVNRAVAEGRAHGPQAGLALLDGLDAPYAHLVRGALLAEAGANERARAELRIALTEARNDAERAQIAERISALDPPGPPC